jgi:putative nucleotidyltransferase with HDIG domain
MTDASAGGRAVGLAEILSALSHALDMTEGQPPNHTLRACLIGMRLADEAGLDNLDREALYYALLLKDAGCSSNAARMAALFGSPDQSVKYSMKLVDWHRAGRLALQTFRNTGGDGGFVSRVSHFLRVARTPDVTRDLIAIRCDRGAEIVRRIGFPDASADAVRSLDEHWNGGGYPDGLAGEQVPLLSRIALLAQTVEIFSTARGTDAALETVRLRRGTWFDPRLADLVLDWRTDDAWWARLQATDVAQDVVACEPGSSARVVDDEGLDRIAGAFAEIIDAKSPFTFRHSTGVAEYARAVAGMMGLPAEQVRRVYRAGLLHDIGKLGISNRILDKAGPLTTEERRVIESHPVYSRDILKRVSAFADFRDCAVLHHEKLDGSGYPWKLTGDGLDTDARILGVVDIYEALTADRPYRAGMPHNQAMDILSRDAGSRLCADSINALEACFPALRAAPVNGP